MKFSEIWKDKRLFILKGNLENGWPFETLEEFTHRKPSSKIYFEKD